MSTLIAGGTVVTVDPENTVIEDGAVLVTGERIADVGPRAELADEYDPDEILDASGKAVIPGLVNLHMHSGYIRGLAEDLPVFEWLAEHVDPTHRALTREDARIAYELCYAETASAGITTVLDMYRYMDEAADVVEEYGLRAVLSPYVADAEGYDYFESLEDNVELVEERHNTADGRISVWFALEHLTYATEEAYRAVADYADAYGVGIHTHGEESVEMAQSITEERGMRPVEVFEDYGILGEKTVLAHCVWLTNREIELLAETGTSVAHCPTSNEKLASGVAPVPKLLNHGVTVGLGTDGIKENNRLDVLQEAKNAALLQKVHTLDATAIPAERALRMATMGGAEALGLDDEIGSLEAGKQADVVLVDTESLHMSPSLGAENVVANLVHAATPGDVVDVFCAGERVVADGEFLPADTAELIAAHTEQAADLVERRDNGEWA